MKKLLTLLLLASSTLYAKTPAQITQQSYPTYSSNLQCRILKSEDSFYCMRVLHTEIRNTPQGKLMYILFGGNYIDPETGEESQIHAASGKAGLFVLKEQAANDWTLLAKSPDNSVGSSGTAPEADEWKFFEFGKDKWGFITIHNDVHQGYAGGHYVILAHNGNKKISTSWIGASADNSGVYGEDCEYFAGDDGKLSMKERRECIKNSNNADSSLTILDDDESKATGGFYPLQLTVSGNLGVKKYRQQKFIIPFNAAKQEYIEPNHYPLKNIDY